MNILKPSFVIIMGLSLILPAAFAEASEGNALRDFVIAAEENNPSIQASYHLWQAAVSKVHYVKSLDDPMGKYGLYGEEVQTRVGPQEQKFALSQKIPFPGKLDLKGKAQSKHAQMLNERYHATVQEVSKDVKHTYYDLFWIDQYIQITAEEKNILVKLEKVIQRKYESNQVTQQDVLKAQVKLSKIIEKQFLLNQQRRSLVVKLNSLLNRPLDSDIQKILQIDRRTFDYELADILNMSQGSRQELKAAGLSIEKSEYEKTLAQMAYLPDFTLGAEYIEVGSGKTSAANDGEDAWMGTVSINLPIWLGKLEAQVEEKQALLDASTQRRQDLKNRVEYEVQDLYFQITAQQDIVLLYETALLPQAEQAFEASQLSFETGLVTFLDWLDTERTYLQTRVAYYKAVTDFHKSYAMLERAVGKEL